MKKIYTIRDADHQREHLWEGHRIEEEVSVCNERSIARLFIDLLPKKDEIVEAGCGLGAWVIFLQEKGYSIAGIDNNEDVIKRIIQARPGIRVSAGDILRLPWPDRSVGAYISLGVVEHFENGPAPALQEAFRVLKPGGVLILAVPFNNLFRRVIGHPLRHLYLLYHQINGRRKHFAEYRYSVREVRKMIEDAGFAVRETGIDDFISKTRSLTLWSEFPFLRGREPYTLNSFGKCFAWTMNSISRNILAAGILVIASRPLP